ncbi:quinone oxidoreductase PIG3 [Pyrus ussuriensis x Pyrus communis]|uniref:Quinone oxidoreductase PIG3 n=1 Tax=Pyrus ussuriensis x Pyrus communis TaxID=2448454 RepID=A0A5N5FDV7_9ROSA|nr:quinone oxidoreductase PIG3 [Pyrus ussuriensis x Pyrus communis]
MKAVVITSPGGPDVLKLQEVEDPQLKDDEVLIKVAATAVNRTDTIQRKGAYPPPPGSSPYLGLECSGTIEAVGKHVSRWQAGDRVCALLSGGGYAEKVAVPVGQVFPIPPGISLTDAASFPEVACTVWSTVFMMSRLSAGETFLVHGGSSGIGTFAIQIAKYQGVRVFVTGGNEEKLAVCKNLGADVCINYKTEDFVARVKEETGGKGVDVILDSIGADYFRRNLDSLNFDGRLFVIGLMSGPVTELDLRVVLSRRLTIQAAGLRYRSPENKAVIVREVENNVWPAIVAGKVKTVIYKSFPLSEAAEAHRLMEIVLENSDEMLICLVKSRWLFCWNFRALELLSQHLFYWKNPKEQKAIIIIILMAPIYAVDSFVGLLDIKGSKTFFMFLDSIKECYEALVIAKFLALMYSYLKISISKNIVPDEIKGREIHHSFPMTLFQPRTVRLNHQTLKLLKYWTWQFVIIRPVCSVLMITLQGLGLYPSWLGWTFTVILNLSVSLALYSLVLFYHVFAKELAPHSPLAKFLCIKGIVFFVFWQGVVIDILAAVGVIRSHHFWLDVEHIEEAIQNVLTCLEMVVFSVLQQYAYHVAPYSGDVEKKMLNKKRE